MRAVIVPEVLARFGVKLTPGAAPGPEVAAGMEQMAAANRKMHWTLVQRGLWVHGAKDFGAYLEAALQMTLEGRLAGIRCPTLLAAAEDDPLSQGAAALLGELAFDKTLMRFSGAEGAGEHCEMSNRSLATMRILDWLEATLAP